MSGLREDQREAEVLVTLIVASLPPEPRWCHRWQASSHRFCAEADFSVTPGSHRFCAVPDISAIPVSHRFCDETDISVTPISTVGAGLPAMRPEQTSPI